VTARALHKLTLTLALAKAMDHPNKTRRGGAEHVVPSDVATHISGVRSNNKNNTHVLAKAVKELLIQLHSGVDGALNEGNQVLLVGQGFQVGLHFEQYTASV
jgi:hypothetical protein